MSILFFTFAVVFALALLFVVVAAARRGTTPRGINPDTGDTSWIANSAMFSDSGAGSSDCGSSDGGGGSCDGGGSH